MSSPYDESLLASAPKATKAQLQDGYNPDLLNEKISSTPPTSSLNPNYHSTALQQEEAALPLNTQKKAPFYRTQKGIIIIVVLVIVIIAAVIGGAVGGTRKKGSKALTSLPTNGTASASEQAGSPLPSATTSSNATSSTTSGGGQGAGSASPTSTSATKGPPSISVAPPPCTSC